MTAYRRHLVGNEYDEVVEPQARRRFKKKAACLVCEGTKPAKNRLLCNECCDLAKLQGWSASARKRLEDRFDIGENKRASQEGGEKDAWV